VPDPGVVVEGSQKANKPSKPPEIDENTGSFAHVLAYKSPKTLLFAQKYLTKYTHETFSRNTQILKLTT
jgi:hypothetical protein